MSTAKDQIKKILESQPEDSSYDDILRELAFKRMVDKGMSDEKNGHVISNKDMEKRIREWQK